MVEDQDLHSDLIRALNWNKQLMDVVVRQADMISRLLERRQKEQRQERGGMASVEGLDRRKADRREVQ